MTVVVALKDISVALGGGKILDCLDLEIRHGENVVVYGPSGSGKSTLLAVIGGHLKPDSGVIKWAKDGDSIERRLPPAWIPQLPMILPGRSVLENVLLGPRITRRMSAETKAQAERKLAGVGLSQMIDRNASVLSGGELQRLAVVRALLAGSDLVIADEPTAALDHDNAMAVSKALFTSSGAAVVVATHDPAVADWCDRVLHLQNGRLVAH